MTKPRATAITVTCVECGVKTSVDESGYLDIFNAIRAQGWTVDELGYARCAVEHCIMDE